MNFRERSYADAVDWYEMAVNTTSEDDGGEFDAVMDDPVYQLQAAMAQLYLDGGYGLEKDASYAGLFLSSLPLCPVLSSIAAVWAIDKENKLILPWCHWDMSRAIEERFITIYSLKHWQR